MSSKEPKKTFQTPYLLSLSEFIKIYSHLVKLRQMRRIIAEADQNGASIFIHRVGKKIFINVEKFFEWTQRKSK